MRFGIGLPAFADFSDPHMLAEPAREAEAAGWHGFFIWDAIFFDDMTDPQIHASAG